MEEIYQLLQARNAYETNPFLSVHASNAALQNLVDSLQFRCNVLEAERVDQKELIAKLSEENKGKGISKTEAKQRDKIEKLQEQLNEKLRNEVQLSSSALKAAKDLSEQKDRNSAQEATISNLQEENKRQGDGILRLTEKFELAETHSRLAEKQYDGLKDTIRSLQEENDALEKLNKDLVGRLVSEKEELMSQMNNMTDMMKNLQREVDMLRTLKDHEEKRGLWGRKIGNTDDVNLEENSSTSPSSRRFGVSGVVVPSGSKQIIKAHASDSTCVRYDATGSDLVATASSDSVVKIWDTGNGQQIASLRGGNGQSMLSVDISGGVAVGCGSEKTCRVWSTRTERMLHQLAGHSNRITSVRLFNNEKSVFSASADRSLKVWDISRSTYKQTTTLRHSSTANCIDVSPDNLTATSGHLDGGVRVWDMRSSDRVIDIADLHIGGVTSVQVNPANTSEILTAGRDSTLKLVDVRTCNEIQTFSHNSFRVAFSYSACALSPDGSYAAAGSGTTGEVFVWRVSDGHLENKLNGHETGVVSLAWGRGGSNGQQVATVDKDGTLILWA